jgi:hypothetical protein
MIRIPLWLLFSPATGFLKTLNPQHKKHLGDIGSQRYDTHSPMAAVSTGNRLSQNTNRHQQRKESDRDQNALKKL